MGKKKVMRSSLILSNMILVFLLCWPIWAYTLTLGDVHVESSLNERLQLRATLQEPATPHFIQVALGDKNAYKKAGWPSLSTLGLSAVAKRQADGHYQIFVTSRQTVSSPIVKIILRFFWQNAKLAPRHFATTPITVLLNPKNNAAYEMNIFAQSESTADAKAKVVSSKAPNVNQESQYYRPTGAYDDLWEIAVKVRPGTNVTVYQVLYALYKANPDAFISGRIARLRLGIALTVPPYDVIAAVNKKEAQTWWQENGLNNSKTVSTHKHVPTDVHTEAVIDKQEAGIDASVDDKPSGAKNQDQVNKQPQKQAQVQELTPPIQLHTQPEERILKKQEIQTLTKAVFLSDERQKIRSAQVGDANLKLIDITQSAFQENSSLPPIESPQIFSQRTPSDSQVPPIKTSAEDQHEDQSVISAVPPDNFKALQAGNYQDLKEAMSLGVGALEAAQQANKIMVQRLSRLESKNQNLQKLIETQRHELVAIKQLLKPNHSGTAQKFENITQKSAEGPRPVSWFIWLVVGLLIVITVLLWRRWQNFKQVLSGQSTLEQEWVQTAQSMTKSPLPKRESSQKPAVKSTAVVKTELSKGAAVEQTLQPKPHEASDKTASPTAASALAKNHPLKTNHPTPEKPRPLEMTSSNQPQQPILNAFKNNSLNPENKNVDDHLLEFETGLFTKMTSENDVDVVPRENAVNLNALDLDAAATQLELAKAYLRMNNLDSAKAVLYEVFTNGSVAQQEEAKRLLANAFNNIKSDDDDTDKR